MTSYLSHFSFQDISILFHQPVTNDCDYINNADVFDIYTTNTDSVKVYLTANDVMTVRTKVAHMAHILTTIS